MRLTLAYGSILLILVLVAKPSCAGVEYCNASNGTSEDYVRGRCVSFGQCPPLFRTLRSSEITVEQLRMLQKLTCLIDEDNPLICCSLTDISASSNYLTSYNKGIAPSKSNADIVYPSTPVYSLKPGLDLSDEDKGKVFSVKSKPKQFDLLPALEECGTSEVIEGSERIIGGSNATHGSYPWMARIGYRNTETGEIEYFCGASVINKNYVLTAAHCTKEIDLSRFQPTVVRLGEYNAESDLDCSEQLGCSRALDFKIEKIIPHPNYGIDEKSNDIELIRIKGNIPFNTPFVRPVCLPFEDEYDISGRLLKTSAKGLVSGWGRTQWNQAEGSKILQEILIPIISNEECRANYSSKIKISEMQMCAGGEKRKDSCGGDSGGPIIVVVPFSTKRLFPSRNSKPFPPVLHPKAFQLGIVSFGPIQCGVGGLPGVYTRVSAYKEWILSNLEP